MPESDPQIEQTVLLLGDKWRSISDGITGANMSLALNLTRYKGVRVYVTTFCAARDVSRLDREHAERNHVTLIHPGIHCETRADLYTKFNEDPVATFPGLKQQIPRVSQIVGHSPITAEGAVKLREDLYPESKLVLFYHIIPGEVDWNVEELPYVIPTDTELVQTAEKADVVYSVTDKLHWYYTAKFRNRAKTEIDHRVFYPQCSEDVFSIQRKKQKNQAVKILVLADSEKVEEWQGLDIATCAIDKMTILVMREYDQKSAPQMIVGGISQGQLTETRDYLKNFTNSPAMNYDVQTYETPDDLYRNLSDCDLCIVPTRSEPYGYFGFQALSAGIPTLISERSALTSLIRRLTSEPEYFLVGVTPTCSAVRQDGSLWRDRILSVVQDLDTAHQRAMQLRTALRRDEPTKESHDNFISYCLGGIKLKHEVTFIEFISTDDIEKELLIMRSFNKFLRATMKQCWRLKHHPLTTQDDLVELLPGLQLPITDLAKKVTDKVEEHDRRIVAVDDKTGSFIVYCPTLFSLTDLWAMCDRINAALVSTLLTPPKNKPCPVLSRYKLKAASVRTIISGPELLQYKQDLMKNVTY